MEGAIEWLLERWPWALPSAADPGWVVGKLGFADPLLLLLLPAVLGFWWFRRGGRPSLSLPGPWASPKAPLGAAREGAGAGPPRGFPRTLRQRLLGLPVLLHALAAFGLLVALARPLAVDVLETQRDMGLDILLVLDRSGSMVYPDLAPPGSEATRLDVVREVALDFAKRRTSDAVFAADRVGLLAFARYPELVCPPTLDFATLELFARRVALPSVRDEDGTGIGVALAKAVELLAASDARSKVVVLLTDGVNNVDWISPKDATQLAVERGVRVYTILAGAYEYDPFGRRMEMALDTTELRAIAEATGGVFQRARDRAALEETYAAIEALERTPREERRERRAKDLYPALLAFGLGCAVLAQLALALGLSRTTG